MNKAELELLTRGTEEIIPKEEFLDKLKSKKKLRKRSYNKQE